MSKRRAWVAPQRVRQVKGERPLGLQVVRGIAPGRATRQAGSIWDRDSVAAAHPLRVRRTELYSRSYG
ncbi:hypothetical protein BMR85_020795 [Achromobacter sp. KAs 3-5]|nr:hypothetical protein BMR85_020795 [Achromobacter sp. KAs 3-5]